MDFDTVPMHCVECGHRWSLMCPVIMENGEEVTKIGPFDDLCPLCDCQGEITEDETRQAG